jgi:micrococcal nuclease
MVLKISRKKIFFIILLICLMVIIGYEQIFLRDDKLQIQPQYTTRIQSSTSLKSQVSQVVNVIDGDSLILEDGSKIRLLGINAPEEDYFFYDQSKTRLESLVLRKNVRLESDFEDKDSFGRLLRYVFVDDVCANIQLVKDGMAHTFMESGLQYENKLLDAEYYAKLHGLGIWTEDRVYIDAIAIVEFHYNAEGDDDENLNNEYVILRNIGNVPINMTGWSITDASSNLFVFPFFVLAPEHYVSIHSGSGTVTVDSLYWDSKQGVWNNKGDKFFLRNTKGELILSYEY